MIEKNSAEITSATAHDHEPYPFGYGHGRMPLFMKVAWLAALIFMTWYVVKFLLTSVGAELAG